MNTLINDIAVGACLGILLKMFKVTRGEMYEEETGIETEETSESGEESITVCHQEAESSYDCQSY